MVDTRISYEDRSQQDLKAAYRIAALIGAVMILSLFIYAAVVEFFRDDPSIAKPRMAAETMEIMRYTLLGVTAVLFFVAGYLQKLFLSGKAARQGSAVQRLITGAVVSYALCESVAIYGLILFFLGGQAMDFYLFMGLSLVFFLVYFPRYAKWEETVKEGRKKAAGAKGK